MCACANPGAPQQHVFLLSKTVKNRILAHHKTWRKGNPQNMCLARYPQSVVDHIYAASWTMIDKEETIAAREYENHLGINLLFSLGRNSVCHSCDDN